MYSERVELRGRGKRKDLVLIRGAKLPQKGNPHFLKIIAAGQSPVFWVKAVPSR